MVNLSVNYSVKCIVKDPKTIMYLLMSVFKGKRIKIQESFIISTSIYSALKYYFSQVPSGVFIEKMEDYKTSI